jgi:plastocyanin
VKKAATIFAAAGLAAFGVAACGSSSDSNTSTSALAPSGPVVTVTADPSQLKFDTTSLTAKPGPTTISLANPSSTPHDLVLQSSDGTQVGKLDPPIANKTGSFTADLKAGTYTYFCDIPGHEAMRGTLTVK